MSPDNIQKVIELTSPIVVEEGCELIDAEIISEEGRKILRLFIDKAGGVQLGDCSRVSHAIEDLLEVEDAVSGAFNLEVSSPGLNRPLKNREHFENVLGQKINVVTKDKIEGRKRYKGILKEVVVDELIIQIDKDDFKVPLSQVAKAHLVFESNRSKK